MNADWGNEGITPGWRMDHPEERTPKAGRFPLIEKNAIVLFSDLFGTMRNGARRAPEGIARGR